MEQTGLNLTDVILNDGKVMHVRVSLSADHFEMPFGSFPIIESGPVDLTVTNKGNQELLFEGSVSLKVEIPCARCMDPVQVPLELSFEVEEDTKLSEDARQQTLAENDFLHGYYLDVDKLVYGEALLSWPSRVLCREDCKGLCKRCGQNLNRKACSCDRTDPDPRMAKIRDIFRTYKEV